MACFVLILWALADTLSVKREEENRHSVSRYLLHVQTELRTLSVLEHQLPPGPWSAVLAHLQTAPYPEIASQFTAPAGRFLDGKDAWRHAFIYELSADGNAATIRSCGRNGIDEHGGNDDIEMTVEMSGR